MREYQISMQTRAAVAEGRQAGTRPVIAKHIYDALDLAETLAREVSFFNSGATVILQASKEGLTRIREIKIY